MREGPSWSALIGLQGGLEDSLEARRSFGCDWCLGHDKSPLTVEIYETKS